MTSRTPTEGGDVTEKNNIWRPIAEVEPDPIERVLRILWSYQDRPIRFITATRYRMAPGREPA
ncbi:MAG: hypothetical protein A2V88_15250 [Elusimicrobia bacterium RBG_16_66_12]|nr:MAG: hypothetical protein A2V88_15250 [Elusimicrobia bacterium RBG_16_66_12]